MTTTKRIPLKNYNQRRKAMLQKAHDEREANVRAKRHAALVLARRPDSRLVMTVFGISAKAAIAGTNPMNTAMAKPAITALRHASARCVQRMVRGYIQGTAAAVRLDLEQETAVVI